jgi:hypothetical protein
LTVAADAAEEAVPAGFADLAGEKASNVTAMMAKTGTTQNAHTHPLEVAGFDKVILLIMLL